MKHQLTYITGIALLFLGVASIVHFVFHAAVAGFPDSVLGSGRNWLFIGFHAVMCIAGLLIVGHAAR